MKPRGHKRPKSTSAPASESSTSPENDASAERKRTTKTQTEHIVERGLGFDLFHTPERVAHASMTVGRRIETHQIHSGGFRAALVGSYYAAHGRAPKSAAVREAQEILAATAVHDGPEYPVFVRIGQQEGRVCVDLADDRGRVVVVEQGQWRVTRDSPMWFARPRGLLALPRPERGGHIDELREHLNLVGEDDWRLTIAWACGALRPLGPYPIMSLEGEPGSAKSTFANVVRDLVDPNVAPLRSLPRREHHYVISANNSWVQVYDNLSRITQDQSDMLCRTSTGGGFATRLLYANDEEIIFNVQRPVILTSIGSVVAPYSDLADRAVVIHLAPIEPARRRDLQACRRRFHDALPRLLGGLLDVFAAATKRVATVSLSGAPRMADFARFGVAIEQCLGWPDGSFLRAYDRNRRDGDRAFVESDAVARGLRQLVQRDREWCGTMTELLPALQREVPNWEAERDFPRDPVSLAGRVRKAAPALRALGISIDYARTGPRRTVTIGFARPGAVTTVIPTHASGLAKSTPPHDGKDADRPPRPRKGRRRPRPEERENAR